MSNTFMSFKCTFFYVSISFRGAFMWFILHTSMYLCWIFPSIHAGRCHMHRCVHTPYFCLVCSSKSSHQQSVPHKHPARTERPDIYTNTHTTPTFPNGLETRCASMHACGHTRISGERRYFWARVFTVKISVFSLIKSQSYSGGRNDRLKKVTEDKITKRDIRSKSKTMPRWGFELIVAKVPLCCFRCHFLKLCVMLGFNRTKIL